MERSDILRYLLHPSPWFKMASGKFDPHKAAKILQRIAGGFQWQPK